MTPTRKCEMRPPCGWAADGDATPIQRSGCQSCVLPASGVLSVALGLLNTLWAEGDSSPRQHIRVLGCMW
jgi:hypothetical protein